MTLQATGAISLADVMVELRTVNPERGYPISLGDADVRALAGVPSGPVSLGNLYGKSAVGEPPPPPPPLTVQTSSGQGSRSTNSGATTVSCLVGANANGGTGTLSYLWEFISNPGQFTLSNSNQPTAMVSKAVARFSSGGDTARLRLTVRDQAGQVVVAEPVFADLSWYGDIEP